MPARMPGPLGLYEITPPIDAGTMCRALSRAPGPTLGAVTVVESSTPVRPRRDIPGERARTEESGPLIHLRRRMRPQDVEAFRAAAARFQVYILLRRTNEAFLRYVGRPGFVPKRIDCKAKTANRNFYHTRLGCLLEVGGLVVKPDLPEFEKAFLPDKYVKAMKEWKKFRPLVEELNDGGPAGRPYVVEINEWSTRYGCVKFLDGGAGKGRYIHADYDLYAIFDRDDKIGADFFEGQTYLPLEREVGTLHGQDHFWGKHFEQVRDFINSRIGVPMIQHGGQEHFAHTGDLLDVFCPDGSVKALGATLTDLTD